MSTESADRCRALTSADERCSRPAEENGFCPQHDESDPTVDEASTSDGTDANTDAETETDEGTETDGPDEDRPTTDESGLLEVRESVQAIGSDLIGRELTGIIGMSEADGGWSVTVEVVERSAVPDTQDILGQYEIDLDSDHAVSGYHRIDRYRRGDTHREEHLG